MTDLTYSVSRQQAADMLGVSTRSVDRYVKRGQLSYKKIANKVLLAREEVLEMQSEFDLLNQQSVQETVVIKEKIVESNPSTKVTRVNAGLGLGSVKEFAEILQSKDQILEEKNQMIYALQHKIGEIETKMTQMVALPDHSAAKEDMKMEIQKLELEKNDLNESIRREKLLNTIFLGLALIAVLFMLFFTMR